MRNTIQSLIFFLITASFINAQDQGQVSGNVQWDAQYYQEDTLIGAPIVPEGIRSTMRAKLVFILVLMEMQFLTDTLIITRINSILQLVVFTSNLVLVLF